MRSARTPTTSPTIAGVDDDDDFDPERAFASCAFLPPAEDVLGDASVIEDEVGDVVVSEAERVVNRVPETELS